ncbi:cysteine/serine-rich nuclear protein 2 [Girardinichthys multiradiatus]|uniref:cysteine/serine-rich nuclear protein 2 n=1 Tax=Girardinichthys multiradiatus TaxID=208333 RepID=UPI001FAB41C2|nr:cysteine/serine-rich nuclear protein 2 [Girardinichthys multiradiatus]XP_047220986.1 cysteine/serine-rich nuclear protein 2 [Girardinichthys multiradiatus]XP_047220994.1 cysteine/serine-rich nuclear protein 2 [Girardinichthys multiradiatus]
MEAGPSISLKRRYEEVDSGSLFSTPKDSDDDISSSDSADSCDSLNPPSSTPFTPTSILRQHKPSPGGKRVRFDVVTVYYFPRRQGFTSVPSQGGSSLGMARHHSSIRHYTLGEFAREQESSHRHTLHQHLRQEKLNARKMKLTRNGTVECAQADLLTLEDVSDEDLDVDAVEVDDCFFLQPLPTKRRRALLRASGIMRIDAREKAELRAIRLSREECGCDCRLFCDPRHCGCSQAGIKCQVDRMSFPCGCSRDGCGNVAGRIEFNPLRVRTHYLHTIMKLDLEKRRLPIQGPGEPYTDSDPMYSPSSTCPTSPTLSSGIGLDSELEESEVQSVEEVHDLMVEQDILERENETAVLHLQSAEEQERREREEAEGEAVQQELNSGGVSEHPLCLLPRQAEAPGVDQILLQGPFPTGATVFCISDTQEESPSDLLKDSSSLLYYQLSTIEPAAFETLPATEEDEQNEPSQNTGGTEHAEKNREIVEAVEGDTHDDISSKQSVGECLTNMNLCTDKCAVEVKERPASHDENAPKEQNQEESSLEKEVNLLPLEV